MEIPGGNTNEKSPPKRAHFSLGSTALEQPLSRSRRRLFLPLTLVVLLVVAGFSVASLLIGVRFTQSLHFENRELSFFEGVRLIGSTFLGNGAPLRGEDTGRINILLLGRAGEKYPGRNLTDTVMILSVDTRSGRAGLLSLPRDLFVPLPESDLSTKLNSLYQIGLNTGMGVELLRGSIAAVTGLPLHYYAMIDFEGFERTIDALGGIRVEVARDIYDPRYPGKNYSYETFELKAGWQKLDGETALRYARERHDDPEGDFGRAKRQQQILQAVRERVWSLPTFLNPFTLAAFLESLGESVTTDIAPEEIGRFVELARRTDTRNVSTVVIDAWKRESLLRVSHIDTENGRAFILVPRSGTWDEVRSVAAVLLEEHGRTEREILIREEKALVHIRTNRAARTVAEELRQDIETSFPGVSVRTQIVPALDNSNETATIQTGSDRAVPFTQDSLVKRYALTPTDDMTDPASAEAPDLVITFTRRSVPGLFDPATTSSSVSPSYDFQEPLPPQKLPGR
jgi:LCP family protein required for cell wall assembly